ncbi:MAG TPA: DUF937 domain-containing protein [Pseudolabrys sp.]|nr:DUF937 domain-containing protein [Pseudolabrys sp.]
MAINLVTLIEQYLTPDLVKRIAAALELDRNDTSTAIDASVPALLAGICGVASQKGGAQKLFDTASQQTGALDKFANMIGGNKTALIDNGSQLLTSLFGGQQQSALAGAVAQYSGLNTGKGSALLGMLAPVVMGTIAGQPAVRGGDTGALANLLASQKDNIAAAMPSGFAKLLGGTGLLDTLGDAARRTGAEATRAAASVARTVDDSRRSAASTSTNWLLWAVVAAAVAGLLIYLLAKPAEQVAQQGVTAVQSLMVGGLDVGKQVTDSIGSLRTTLAGITDTASAQAALPKLQNATAQIDKVSGMIGQMSEGQRKVLAGLVNPVMSTLNQLFDKVLAIPGVAEIIKPTIDTLKTKLAILTA